MKVNIICMHGFKTHMVHVTLVFQIMLTLNKGFLRSHFYFIVDKRHLFTRSRIYLIHLLIEHNATNTIYRI